MIKKPVKDERGWLTFMAAVSIVVTICASVGLVALGYTPQLIWMLVIAGMTAF